MKRYRDTTTVEVWTEKEIREIFEQLRTELQDERFEDYMADRIRNGWMEKID